MTQLRIDEVRALSANVRVHVLTETVKKIDLAIEQAAKSGRTSVSVSVLVNVVGQIEQLYKKSGFGVDSCQDGPNSSDYNVTVSW